MRAYHSEIQSIAPLYDPRHIEAYMRVAHSTLDSLSNVEFRREVLLCAMCVEEGGTEAAEACAKSFGI
jgi:hypothetical protein